MELIRAPDQTGQPLPFHALSGYQRLCQLTEVSPHSTCTLPWLTCLHPAPDHLTLHRHRPRYPRQRETTQIRSRPSCCLTCVPVAQQLCRPCPASQPHASAGWPQLTSATAAQQAGKAQPHLATGTQELTPHYGPGRAAELSPRHAALRGTGRQQPHGALRRTPTRRSAVT